MPDTPEQVDDPLGDLSTITHAAARLALAVTSTEPKNAVQRRAMQEDARTILAVWKRLEGRL